MSMIRVHGTCIALDGDGVLLRGPPGSGKSDLALRLIDGGAMLVADDQTELRRVGEAVVASPPSAIAGRIELRGIGILSCPSIAEVRLRLVVDLVAPDAIERLPERRTQPYLGCALPLLAVTPFEASAAAKLRFAMRRLHDAAGAAFPESVAACGGVA
jgi:serine kinase of HPr protein (carbohydrate metabolism regulator)